MTVSTVSVTIQMSDPWFKFYPSDWLGGTGGMTAAERGVYITLVAMIYDHGAPIRRDDSRLARRCGVTKASWLKIIRLLIEDGKITTPDDGLLSNDRCEIELSDRANRVQNATSASEKAAEARAGKIVKKQPENPPPDDPPDIGRPPIPEARSQSIGDDDSACAPEASESEIRERVLAAMGVGPDGVVGPSKFIGGTGDVSELRRWLELPNLTPDLICGEVARISARKRDGPPKSFTYFTEAMRRLSGQLSAPALTPIKENRPNANAQSARDRRDDAASDALQRRIMAAARVGEA